MPISLRSLLIIPFVFQAVGVTFLVGYVSYRSGQAAVSDLAYQLMAETGDRVHEKLDRYLQSAHQINQSHVAAFKSGAIGLDDLDQLHRYLILQHQQLPEMTSFHFGTSQGDFLVSHRVSAADFETGITLLQPSDLPFEVGRSSLEDPSQLILYAVDEMANFIRPIQILKNIDVRDRPWYRKAIDTQAAGWSEPFQIGDTNLLALNAYVPVYDDQAQLQGVFSINISLSQLNIFLGHLQIGDSGEVFVIEPNGALIANSAGEAAYTISDAVPHMDNSPIPVAEPNLLEFRRLTASASANPLIRNGAEQLQAELGDFDAIQVPLKTQVDIGGDRYFLRAMPYRDDYGLNWVIVTIVPRADFTGRVQRNLHNTVALCGLTLLGSIGFIIWLTRCIARPIGMLNRATQAFTTGDLHPSTQATPIQEIESLRQAFHRMGDRLDDSFQELKASEQRFSILLENVPVGVVVLTPKRQVIWENRLSQALFSYPTDTADPAQLSAVYRVYRVGTDELYPVDQLPVMRALQGETVRVDDIEIVYESGERIPLEVRAAPVRDAAGQIIYAIAAFQDIRERREVERLRSRYQQELEREVVEKTAALEQAQHIAQVGSWTLDVATGQTHWTNALLRILGLDFARPPDSYCALFELIPVAERDGIRRAVEAAIADGVAYEVEHQIMRLDGAIRHLVSRGEAIRDDQGRVITVLGTAADISDRKRAELALQESESTLRQITENLPVFFGLRLLDRSRWLYINPAFEKITGYPAARLYENPDFLQAIVATDDRLVWATDADGDRQAQDRIFRVIRADGEYIWLRLVEFPVYSAQGEPYRVATLAEDVTEQRQAELELQQLYAQLQVQATVDSLTQVANRYQLEAALKREWQRCQREKTPISLLLVDIDHFKAYNDHYGHISGDACLRQVAQVLQSCLHRPSDLVARYGGEEFVVVLPNTDWDGAAYVAERIQRGVFDRNLPHAASKVSDRITVSMGGAIVHQVANFTPEDALHLADKALYQAKRSRNSYRIQEL